MSRSLGAELPPDLAARLDGTHLEDVASKAIQIFTVDAAGWPHAALLSYFEVIAQDRGRIRLVTYKTSTTSGNMRRNGKVTLVVIDERVAYYVKGQVVELASSLRATDWNAAFESRVIDVSADEVNEEFEPGAYIAGGVTYFSPQRARELERARSVLAELRGL